MSPVCADESEDLHDHATRMPADGWQAAPSWQGHAVVGERGFGDGEVQRRRGGQPAGGGQVPGEIPPVA